MLVASNLCPGDKSIQCCVEDVPEKDVAAVPSPVPDLKLQSLIGLPLNDDVLKAYTVPSEDGAYYSQNPVVESEDQTKDVIYSTGDEENSNVYSGIWILLEDV